MICIKSNLEDCGQNQVQTKEWVLAAGTRVFSRAGQDADQKERQLTGCPLWWARWQCHSHIRGDQQWLPGENAEMNEVTGVLQQAKSEGRTQEVGQAHGPVL